MLRKYDSYTTIQYSTNKYRATRDNIDRRFNTGKKEYQIKPHNPIRWGASKHAGYDCFRSSPSSSNATVRRIESGEKGEESPFLKASCSRELRFEISSLSQLPLRFRFWICDSWGNLLDSQWDYLLVDRTCSLYFCRLWLVFGYTVK